MQISTSNLMTFLLLFALTACGGEGLSDANISNNGGELNYFESNDNNRSENEFSYTPQAINLSINITPQAGNTLEAEYEFFAENLAEETNTEIKWTLGDAVFYQSILTLSDSDIGKDITLCVTPASNDDTAMSGKEVCTDSYAVQPSIDNWTGLGPITLQGRHDGNGVDILVLGDGWTSEQMGEFKQTVLNFQEKFMSYDSINIHRSAWNIHAVGVVSNESGVSTSTTPVDTYFKSCAACGDLDRIVTADVSIGKQVAASHFPQYDTIVILVNSTIYGGSAGEIAVSTASPDSVGVIIHELGHSFAKLKDEYNGSNAATIIEPLAPNLTLENNADISKWGHWITPTAGLDKGAVGFYGDGSPWTPTETSIMKKIGEPFYAVNAEVWALMVYGNAQTIYKTMPNDKTNYTHSQNKLQNFSLSSVFAAGLQTTKWYLNGDLISEGTDLNFQLPTYQQGSYEVTVVISDNSGLIIKDDNKLSSQEITWNVTAI